MSQIPYEIVGPNKEQIYKPLFLIIIWRPGQINKSYFTFIIVYVIFYKKL